MSATITPVSLLSLGSILDITVPMQAATAADSFLNTGTEALLLTNGSGATETVSVAFGNTIDGKTLPAQTFAILAGKTALIGPFPPRYTATATGLVNITYSDHTSLTVAAIRVPKAN